jgi:hypothetical protein
MRRGKGGDMEGRPQHFWELYKNTKSKRANKCGHIEPWVLINKTS